MFQNGISVINIKCGKDQGYPFDIEAMVPRDQHGCGQIDTNDGYFYIHLEHPTRFFGGLLGEKKFIFSTKSPYDFFVNGNNNNMYEYKSTHCYDSLDEIPEGKTKLIFQWLFDTIHSLLILNENIVSE